MTPTPTQDRVYTVAGPAQGRLPLVFDSPHSGRIYPDDFQYACPRDVLERAEDNRVDELFSTAPHHGATLLCAQFPRTYIDVNRAQDDVDTELLAERWPGPLNPSPRSHAGIGLIRRLIRPGIPVYDRPLSVAEIRHRLDRYYHPYHAALKGLLDTAHYSFGQVWHVNCHSMPASKLGAPAGFMNMQPDFVLGDRDGTSCAPEFTVFMRDALRQMGYRVAINNPYKGVEIVRRAADPHAGRHSIQIEINKALYWDENKGEKTINFNMLKGNIDKLISQIGDFVSGQRVDLAAD